MQVCRGAVHRAVSAPVRTTTAASTGCGVHHHHMSRAWLSSTTPASSSSSSSSSSTWLDPLSPTPARQEADGALLTFPEAREAEELLETGGPPTAALPLLLRVVDVCSNMMPGSPLQDAALRRSVSVCEKVGDAEQGKALLTRLCDSTGATPTDAAQYHQKMASLQLGTGDVPGARSSLDEAEARCGSPSSSPEAAGVWAGIASVRAAVSCVTGDSDDHDLDAAASTASELVDVPPVLRHLVLHHTGAFHLFRSGAGTVHDPLEGLGAGGPGVAAAASLDDGSVDASRMWFAAAKAALTELGHHDDLVSSLLLQSKLGMLELQWAENGATTVVEDLKSALDKASELVNTGNFPGYTKAWPLVLLGRVYHAQEEPVTSEGLFRAAMDEFDQLDMESKSRLPSTVTAVLADTLRWYARLLNEWDQRAIEAEIVLSRADDVISSDTGALARLRHVVTPRWGFHSV